MVPPDHDDYDDDNDVDDDDDDDDEVADFKEYDEACCKYFLKA